MRIRVETAAGEDGAETLRCMHWDDREIEIVETLDQWHGADHRYVKLRDRDGNLYILRHDETRDAWELILFEKPGAATQDR